MEKQEDNLDGIIEQKLTFGEIIQAYDSGRITWVELMLLRSLDNDGYYHRILTGMGEYKLPFMESVSDDFCFTNVPWLLSTFDSLYHKYPLYHFDRLLEYGLLRMCNSRFDLYNALYLTHFQLQREKEGRAAFSIQAAPILRKIALYFHDEYSRSLLEKSKAYNAANYEDGMVGLCRAYDPLFIEMTGVSVLGEE